MLNCCKSNQGFNYQQFYNQTPQYKYSLKQKSQVLMNPRNAQLQYMTPYQYAQSMTPRYQQGLRNPFKNNHYVAQQALQLQYENLQRQNRNLETIIQRQIKPLENEVMSYEQRLNHRKRQITELKTLLDVVANKKLRKSSQPKGARNFLRSVQSPLLLYK